MRSMLIFLMMGASCATARYSETCGAVMHKCLDECPDLGPFEHSPNQESAYAQHCEKMCREEANRCQKHEESKQQKSQTKL